MTSFITLITNVLSIELTIGGTTMPLGGILLGILLLWAAKNRLFDELANRHYQDNVARGQGFRDFNDYREHVRYYGGHPSRYNDDIDYK